MRTAEQDSLLTYLSGIAGLAEGKVTGWASSAAFELGHGSFFPSQAYDSRKYGKPGPMKECFANAAMLAHRHGLPYVEGHCLSRIGIPILHAFCLDEEGRVVDPTWRDPADCLYHGVKLQAAKVLHHHIACGYHVSMLDDYMNRWPLTSGKFTYAEWAA